jgi:hypothetical protein
MYIQKKEQMCTKRNVRSEDIQNNTRRTINQQVFLSAVRQSMMPYQLVVTRDISVKGQGSVSTTGILFQRGLEFSFRHQIQTELRVPKASSLEAVESPSGG